MDARLPAELTPEFDQLFADVAARWAPGGKLQFIKQLGGGNTGAGVLKVDLSYPPGVDQYIPPGQYILKLYRQTPWQTGPNSEEQRHRRAVDRPTGSNLRIPELVEEHSVADEEGTIRSAILYHVAGNSLAMLTALADARSQLEAVGAQLTFELLDNWSADEVPVCGAKQLLESWLKYRLDRKEAPKLHEFVDSEFGGKPEISAAHQAVVNPLWLYSQLADDDDREVRLDGLLHGDLHLHNILVDRYFPDRPPFWLIDLALTDEGPLGYDQGYLEMALIQKYLRDPTPEQVVNLCDAAERTPRSESIPTENKGLLGALQAIRDAVRNWQEQRHPTRRDAVDRQFTLARVAAGLNWANKPLSEADRRVALYYSAWNARRYLEVYRKSLWDELGQGTAKPKGTKDDADDEAALWKTIWKEANGFDARSTRHILIADRQIKGSNLQSIGLLPWTAVIDLDAESDVSGLHSEAIGTLRRRRAVREFSLSPETDVDAQRGTAWMFAAGWNRRSEDAPDLETWKRKHRGVVRDFVESIARSVSPSPVRVYILPRPDGGSEDDRRRLDYLTDVIDEKIGSDAVILHLGPRPPISAGAARHFPISVSGFLRSVVDTYGKNGDSHQITLPGADGVPAVISVETLREFEADLELLHSEILDTSDDIPPAGDSPFWRGSAPTWHDLNADLDVPRQIEAPLVEQLREALEHRRIYTVELRHQPGSGGTTLARRIAWNMRGEYPIALLRSVSKTTVGHLERLFHTVGRPILLVADAAVLTDQSRNDLMEALRGRNCRLVMLYVRRVVGGSQAFRSDDVKPKDVTDHRLELHEPMLPEEAERFFRAYSKLTDNAARIDELRKITRRPEFERYRSPFFYGLITFERDFSSVKDYVANHTRDIRRGVREGLEYLALVTRFSKGAMHEIMLRRLLGQSSGKYSKLEETFKDGPMRLLLRQAGRVKLMHPVIAEEVLQRFADVRNWRLDLADLSIRLIEDVVRRIGPTSQEVASLFSQLFIAREDASTLSPVDDREQRRFSELIETIDNAGKRRRAGGSIAGHKVLEALTSHCPDESHFWNHLGRHRAYRLKERFDEAEQNLRKAIKLSPTDRIHYHTLGLVLRFWIENDLREKVYLSRHSKGPSALTPAAILKMARGRFDVASQAFAEARRINRADEHVYVTEIQMILFIAKQMKIAADDDSIKEMVGKADEVGRWLTESIGQAESLLEVAREMHGQYDVTNSRHLQSCLDRLDSLYGDFDKVIREWEMMLDRGHDHPASRRALADAYAARRHRNWSEMPERDARRIVELAERNLEEGGLEADFRLWFNAYKTLRDFEIDDAIFRLQQWSNTESPLRAYYYLYILNFINWFRGERHDTDQFEEYLQLTQKLSTDYRKRTFEWFSYDDRGCPLAGEGELGEWVPEQEHSPASRKFWSNTKPLRRVNGIIESMTGQQAGKILIGGAVEVFFVPGTEFWQSADVNKAVNFFLGFSYTGLRAYSPQAGHVENGDRRRSTDGPVKAPMGEEIVAAAAALRQADRNALKQGVRELIAELLEVRATQEEPLLLAEVVEQLDRMLDTEDVVGKLGHPDAASMIRTFHDFEVVRNGPNGDEVRRRGGAGPARPPARAPVRKTTHRGTVVRYFSGDDYGFIAPDGGADDHYFHLSDVDRNDRATMARGKRVAFLSQRGGKSMVARNVSIVKKIAAQPASRAVADLREQAARFVESLVFEGELDQEQFTVAEVEAELSREVLNNDTVPARLAYESIYEFLYNEVKDVVVTRSEDDDGKVIEIVTRAEQTYRSGIGDHLVTPVDDDDEPAAKPKPAGHMAGDGYAGNTAAKNTAAKNAGAKSSAAKGTGPKNTGAKTSAPKDGDSQPSALSKDEWCRITKDMTWKLLGHAARYLNEFGPELLSHLPYDPRPLKNRLGTTLSKLLAEDERFEVEIEDTSVRVRRAKTKPTGGPGPAAPRDRATKPAAPRPATVAAAATGDSGSATYAGSPSDDGAAADAGSARDAPSPQAAVLPKPAGPFVEGPSAVAARKIVKRLLAKAGSKGMQATTLGGDLLAELRGSTDDARPLKDHLGTTLLRFLQVTMPDVILEGEPGRQVAYLDTGR